MNILITGGTGSFGQAMVKYLLTEQRDTVWKIIIYSRDEHKQEQMANRFKDLDRHEKLRFFIGDIRDKERLKLALNRVSNVIHTAALKIVPAAEYNPFEVVKTNIIGTQNLIDSVTNQHVIALSTDKAVNPINLYGATKLCMEKMLIAANNIHGGYSPRFEVVRYGNVANSTGSVITIFKKQLSEGLPLTITDPNMTRFWITLEEAVKFVWGCISFPQDKKLHIPKMPSFRVIDLADVMNPGKEHKIIGIRPGEKLHEQIDENTFSNSNLNWLRPVELKQELQKMGVL